MHNMAFVNTEEFEACVEPVAGSVRTRPPRGSKLSGTIRIAKLNRIGFLAIDSDPMITCIDQEAGFYGLTITQGAPFKISDGPHRERFSGNSAHLLTPDQAFDFRTNDETTILGTNFFVDILEEYAYRLSDNEDDFRLPEDDNVSLVTPAGASLTRYLSFIWRELNLGGGILNSDLVVKEIEDALIAALIYAIDENADKSQPARNLPAKTVISRAEEYLLGHLSDPVSRTELAQHAGVSVRTLSRAFARQHGMGPMEFLKQHRLEAARNDLFHAEPGETTVSDIALRYGFAQPSKFTEAYKAAFNETPSSTLRGF